MRRTFRWAVLSALVPLLMSCAHGTSEQFLSGFHGSPGTPSVVLGEMSYDVGEIRQDEELARDSLKLNPIRCRGDFKKYTLVKTNDPRRTSFTLVLQGRIKQ